MFFKLCDERFMGKIVILCVYRIKVHKFKHINDSFTRFTAVKIVIITIFIVHTGTAIIIIISYNSSSIVLELC